jgi:hypothetical protein
LALTLIVIALFAIPLTGTYRGLAKTGDWSQLVELRPGENLKILLKKVKY